MRYVKIRAKTYNEAMMKLKMDHGDDAIPISHKYVKEGGLFNSKMFAKDVVELTAAIQERKTPAREKIEKKGRIDITVGDETVKKSVTPRVVTDLNDAAPRETPMKSAVNSFLGNLEADIRAKNAENDEEPVAPVTVLPPATVTITKEEFSSFKKFEKEFHEIKETLKRMMDQHGREGERHGKCQTEEDRLLDPYRLILKNNEYDHEESNLIMEEVRNSMSREDMKDKYKIEKSLKEFLKSRIVTKGPIKMGHKKKVIMFFGPTGVGKTTTMAKLGAIYALREGHSVSFITIDNYRIAATEQLKKYAEIMKIPVHVVNDQRNFKDILEKEKAEIIMIDTSGRSHRNELKISEIKSFADVVEYDFEKILCVSANTKKIDAGDIFKAFDKIHFDSLIITKVDETSYIGNIIDVADKYKKPIAYYTNGQEVPNDIVVADADKIINLIMGTQTN